MRIFKKDSYKNSREWNNDTVGIKHYATRDKALSLWSVSVLLEREKRSTHRHRYVWPSQQHH